MSREQRRAIDAMLRKAPQDFNLLPVEQMREGFARLMGRFPVSDEVTQVPIELAGRPAVLVEPKSGARPGTILYFHGGSFSLGSPQTAMSLTAELVRRTGVRAMSIDYRLAPEHPFPAGIEDCLSAYRSLLDDGADAASIVFAGDSAGGGLVVTTSLSARDAGLPLPAALIAFSPGLDHTRSGATMISKSGIDPLLTREGVEHTGALYLSGQNPEISLLAPAVHADLSGLPPVLLQVGTNEILLDDSVRFAARARDAEVDVILDVTADVPHVFQMFTGMLDEAGYALDRAALFIVQHLAE
ncbi:alpha/beta hydrolase [Burkholderia sp. 22PA0106]|uniref:alpha/beta hydrolase n=1 Tax=Burkholderia sp. 22PA0106 TaxID=3237371 RepID=UPI0039C30CBB